MTGTLGGTGFGIFAFDNVGWSTGECFGTEGCQVWFGAVASRIVAGIQVGGEWYIVGGGGIRRWGNLNDWTGGSVCFIVGYCWIIVVAGYGGSVDSVGGSIDWRSTDGHYIVASGSDIGLSSLGL
jgi:hypothetical protein